MLLLNLSLSLSDWLGSRGRLSIYAKNVHQSKLWLHSEWGRVIEIKFMLQEVQYLSLILYTCLTLIGVVKFE